MQEPKHDKERQIFQVERFTYFTDAVFAISITLLIIEIQVPKPEANLSDKQLWHSLSAMGLMFLGFVISFGIIGHYWSVHHRIFGYVKKNSTTLIWLNHAFLLTVVTLPFSSALVGEYSSDMTFRIPYAIYTFNMCMTGFMNCWIWVYVSNPKRQMLTREISKSRIKLGVYRSLIIPIMFVISFLIFLMSPIIGYCTLLLIPIILHWGMSGIEKNAEREENLSGKLISKASILVKEEVKNDK
jgi:uncharacterized membrane protein